MHIGCGKVIYLQLFLVIHIEGKLYHNPACLVYIWLYFSSQMMTSYFICTICGSEVSLIKAGKLYYSFFTINIQSQSKFDKNEESIAILTIWQYKHKDWHMNIATHTINAKYDVPIIFLLTASTICDVVSLKRLRLHYLKSQQFFCM